MARSFVRDLNTHNKLVIHTAKKISKNKILLKILNYKYISPFVGIFFCWFFFLTKKNIAYINYLPLWNSILFIFLPPKTTFGPITGGANYVRSEQFFIRKYIFPILYKISEFFLNLRNINIVFSTDLLQSQISKKTKKKSLFNYVFKLISVKKKREKTIDFLIYHRNHYNKKQFFPYDLVGKLVTLNFKVHIIGDHLNNRSVVNHGFVNNKKVESLMEKTHYSLVSNENIYGLFTIECINNHVRLIMEQKSKSQVKYFKENFIFIHFDKIEDIKKLKNF